jgi:hypothetical protein
MLPRFVPAVWILATPLASVTADWPPSCMREPDEQP